MYLGTGAAIPEHLTVARRLARDARLDRNRSLHCRACLLDFSPCCASLLRITAAHQDMVELDSRNCNTHEIRLLPVDDRLVRPGGFRR